MNSKSMAARRLFQRFGTVAKKFYDAGYSVIVNGFMDEVGWTTFLKCIQPTHKIILLPDLTVTIKRDANRTNKLMGLDAVTEHHTYFSSNFFYDNFTKIDTSSHTEEQTVELIFELLSHAAR